MYTSELLSKHSMLKHFVVILVQQHISKRISINISYIFIYIFLRYLLINSIHQTIYRNYSRLIPFLKYFSFTTKKKNLYASYTGQKKACLHSSEPNRNGVSHATHFSIVREHLILLLFTHIVNDFG